MVMALAAAQPNTTIPFNTSLVITYTPLSTVDFPGNDAAEPHAFLAKIVGVCHFRNKASHSPGNQIL